MNLIHPNIHLIYYFVTLKIFAKYSTLQSKFQEFHYNCPNQKYFDPYYLHEFFYAPTRIIHIMFLNRIYNDIF